MKNPLIFKNADVRRVMEHSLKGEAFTLPHEPNPPPNEQQPGFLLVHDDGVYLMSNSQDPDLINPQAPMPARNKRFCARAAGCDPTRDEDYYDRARSLVGGDDFAEFIPIEENLAAAVRTFGSSCRTTAS